MGPGLYEQPCTVAWVQPWEELIRDVAADELSRHAAAYADEMADLIHGDLPELATGSIPWEDTRASCEGNIRLIFVMLRDGMDPATAEPPAEAVTYAHDYVEHGLGLPPLLRAYRVGHARLWRHWIKALESAAPDPETLMFALSDSAERMFAYIDTVSDRLTRIYDAARERWSRSAEALRAETVRSILEERTSDAEQAGARLRYPLTRAHLAIVVWGEESDGADLHLMLEKVAAALAARTAVAEPLVVPLGRRMVAAWLPGADPDAVARTPLDASGPAPVRVAVGLPGEGLDGFRRSHQEAMLARRVARLSARRPGSVTRYGRVALQALASADLEHARAFVERELGPLASDDEQALRLAATLRAFFEEGTSPLRTAQRLGVHTNTVTYRLNQAKELLGRDPAERGLELQVALALVKLVAEHDESA